MEKTNIDLLDGRKKKRKGKSEMKRERVEERVMKE
jgi:hypothetical protein